MGKADSRLNPLTTNDNYSCHQNSAACYQLAQSALKISSALAERVGQGEVGGCTALANSAWRLLLFCTNEHRKRSFQLVGALFLAF